MKNITALATAGLVAVTVSSALVGCGSTTRTETSPSAATDSTSSAAASPAPEDGLGATLHRYIVDNKIAETPFRADEPGTPQIDFPFPPDWSSAGDDTPDWAYGAIVYDKAVDPEDPPTMIAIASKLTGNVDAAKVLEYAPGQLNDLPEFTAIGEPVKDSLGGFDAIDYAGTYMWEGKQRVVGQQTIVIPGKDGLFVLQLNADAPQGQQDVVLDAVKLISDQTTITVPS